MNFDDVLNYLPKKRALKNEVYTQYDEIYSIWNLGNYLGIALLSYVEKNECNKLKESFNNFIYSYHLIKSSSKVLSIEDSVVNDLIAQTKLDLIGFDQNFDDVLTLIRYFRNLIYSDIKAYSTHLANIFSFGYSFRELHALLLLKEVNVVLVKQELNEVSDSIDAIIKGDKKLESPNLEISKINIRIIKQALKLLNKHCSKLLAASKTNFNDYREFINSFFIKMLLEIVLDIKNPIQYIRNKTIFIIIYYYAFVFILIAAVKIEYMPFYKDIQSYLAPLIPTGNDKLQFIILIIIPLISILIISFRELKNLVVISVIYCKIRSHIKKILRD